jgi:hypothetical protein
MFETDSEIRQIKILEGVDCVTKIIVFIVAFFRLYKNPSDLLFQSLVLKPSVMCCCGDEGGN